MAHHSNEGFDPEVVEAVKRHWQSEARRLGLGATGRFPEGKLADHDEGESLMTVTNCNGTADEES